MMVGKNNTNGGGEGVILIYRIVYGWWWSYSTTLSGLKLLNDNVNQHLFIKYFINNFTR
jgi:hypothetical protein